MGKRFTVVSSMLVLLVFVLISFRYALINAETDSHEKRLEVPGKFGLSGLYTLFGTNTPKPWEFSLGLYIDYSKFTLPADPREPRLTEVRFGAGVGIIPKLQIALSIPALDLYLPEAGGISDFADSSFGDLILSGKYRILDEETNIPAIALYGLVSFPTGDEELGFGSGSTDFTFGGIFTKRISTLKVYGNLGYLISGYEAGDPNPLLRSLQNSLVYGVGLDVPITESRKLNLFTEATFVHEFGNDAEEIAINFLGIPVEDKVDDAGQLNMGVQFGFGEGFVLTGGGGFKIIGEEAVPEAPSWRFFGGLTYTFAQKSDIDVSSLPRPVLSSTPPPTRVIPAEPPIINKCPEITEFILSDSEIGGKERVMVSVEATDDDGDLIVYQWTSTGGDIIGTGGNVIWVAPDCKTIGKPSMSYDITVTVSDNQCPVTQTQTIVVTCEQILEGIVPFDLGSTRLNNLAKAGLDIIATVLKKFPDENILIEGHTDATGSEAMNKQIALKRAESVRAYLLTRHGIEAKRIIIESLGSSRPIAPNDTEEGQKQNRRVEIYRLAK